HQQGNGRANWASPPSIVTAVATHRHLRRRRGRSRGAAMWSWLASSAFAPFTNNANRRLTMFKREFNLASMQHLHAQLLQFEQLPDSEMVELLRVLSEFLIYSDQNRTESVSTPSLDAATFATTTTGAGVFFDYFCEKNILGLLLQVAETQPSIRVQIQLLQTLSILVQNIATRTSLYYILSNNYVNKLLECPFAYDTEDDVRDWYVTLLKALSLRLNEDTVQFFFDTQRNAFPLYSQALKFGRCSETMVKVAVKTLTLNVFRVQDDRVRCFVLAHENMAFFHEIVDYFNEIALKIQGLLNIWEPKAAPQDNVQTSVQDKLEEAIDEYIDHCYYLQDILDINLPELCYKLGDMLFTRHIKDFLGASILPDCNPPPQRVSTRLALYLLTRFVGIFEHAPLLNAVSFLLLSPDAPEDDCKYSAVALGAGSRKRSVHHKTNATPKAAATPTVTPTHTFRAHSSAKCNSSLCYLQTRFSQGEWPVEEVERFVPSDKNAFRQSIFALMLSDDELLSSAATLLLLSLINSEAVDHSLLRELHLLPYRHRRHRQSNGHQQQHPDNKSDSNEQEDASDSSSSASESTNGADMLDSSEISMSADDETETIIDEEPADNSVEERKVQLVSPRASTESYTEWLVELALQALTKSVDRRLLNLQLCALLLLDATHDSRDNTLTLKSKHAAMLRDVHSASTYGVMQSMRGAMSDVDLFIYVLEDEYEEFQSTKFPVPLTLKTSIPFEYVVPFRSCVGVEDGTNGNGNKTSLAMRGPTNEMEACRKSMRVFLTLRRLRQLLDPEVKDDGLDRFVTYRHPHTTILNDGGVDHSPRAICVEGMVYIKCIWREQRFLQTPAKLYMVLNPEALVLIEKHPSLVDNYAYVRLFAPIHRSYSSIDGKDDLVLHFTISSATAVHGCRSYHRVGLKENHLGNLKTWHVSVLFESSEDCRQAKAHVDLCRAEVRAYKLLKIEESLLEHAQDVHGGQSPRRSRGLSLTARDESTDTTIDALDAKV
ncbi:TPA: hypothetical protein N0F65_008674, partial [Lagenidium giganteum]